MATTIFPLLILLLSAFILSANDDVYISNQRLRITPPQIHKVANILVTEILNQKINKGPYLGRQMSLPGVNGI